MSKLKPSPSGIGQRLLVSKKLEGSRCILCVNLVWSILVILCSGAAALHLPILAIYPWIIAVFLGTLIVLAAVSKPITLRWNAVIPLLLFLATLTWTFGSYGLHKRFISTHPDTWFYCTFSEYLARFPRGLSGGLAPIYQWASHASEMRFGTASLLAFLASVFRTDAVHVLTFYTLLMFGMIFWSVALLARMLGCRPWLSIAAGCFSVLGGLIPDTVIVGNFDNLLFLSLFPSLIVRALLFARRAASSQSTIAFSVNCAAVLYAYPEGALIAGVICLPLFLDSLLKKLRNPKWPRQLASLLICTALLALPYLGVGFGWTLYAFQLGIKGEIASDLFSGLFLPPFLPSIIGTGEEFNSNPSAVVDLIFSAACILLIVIGAFYLLRRNPSIVLCIIPLVLLCFWQGGLQHYGYGLYKVLLIGSILTTPFIFLGLQRFPNQALPVHSRWIIPTTLGLLLIFGSMFTRQVNHVQLATRKSPRIEEYAKIARLGRFVGDAPILLLTHTDFDQTWATYFLSEMPFTVDRYLGYLAFPHVRELLENAKKVPSPPSFILSDFRTKDAIWSSGTFWLSPRGKVDPNLTVRESANGIERVNDRPFLWIGSTPVKFSVSAKESCMAIFHCDEVRLGPSRPNIRDCTISVTTSHGHQRETITDHFSIPICLDRGENDIEIAVEDRPTITHLANKDPRTLLLGLLNYQIDAVGVH